MEFDELSGKVIGCAIEVHKNLGPGLLELVYEATLTKKLRCRGLAVWRQVPIAIEYNGLKFHEGFRADLIVEGKVLVELKSVEKLHPAHKKQLLTYMRLANMKLGYLLNFGEAVMKDGITRTINGEL